MKQRNPAAISEDNVHTVVVSRLDQGDLAFLPDTLRVGEKGINRIDLRLDDSVPEGLEFQEPCVIFREEGPFVIGEPSADGRRVSIFDRNQQEGFTFTEYEYRVVLGPTEDISAASPDPSIINHGTDGWAEVAKRRSSSLPPRVFSNQGKRNQRA